VNGSFIKEFNGLEPIDRGSGFAVGGWGGGNYNGDSRMAGIKVFAHAMGGGEIRREMYSLRPVGVEPYFCLPYDDKQLQPIGFCRSALAGYSITVEGATTDPEFSSDNPTLPRFYPKRRIFLPNPATYLYSRPTADLSNSGWVRYP
jgi:hypothetical protein